MSDQGYGGSGPGGPPEWGQQPNYGPSPNYGDQYGQPYYGEPQYPSDQYGQQQFGPYTGAAPPNSGGSQKGILIGLAAVIVAGLVVLVLALTGVFSGDATKTASPKDAAEALLLASKNQNLDDAKKVLCAKDLADPEVGDIVGAEHATDYTVGKVDQQSVDRASVAVTLTAKGKKQNTSFPVVKENGGWKVCFSEAGATSGSSTVTKTVTPAPPISSAPSLSLPSISIPTISVPTLTTGSFCASTIDAATTARVFASAITLSSIDLAAGCVYQNKLSQSDLQGLTGTGADRKFAPTVQSGDTGPVFDFPSVDGSATLSVRVEKESDGKYYVTAAALR